MVLIVPVNARPQKREFSTRKPYAIAETKNFVDIGRLSLYFCARSEIRIPVFRDTARLVLHTVCMLAGPSAAGSGISLDHSFMILLDVV